MNGHHILITFPEPETADRWLDAFIPPAGASAQRIAVAETEYDHEYQFATLDLLPQIVSSISAILEDDDLISPGQWPQTPPAVWPQPDRQALLRMAVTRFHYLGHSDGQPDEILQAWHKGELPPMGNIDQALNLEHPTGMMCRCPECEHHDPATCEGHCCQQPDEPTDCRCREPRTEGPDFLLATVDRWAIAWPATHLANRLSLLPMPDDIHDGGDRLVAAAPPDYLEQYLSRLGATTGPAPAAP